MSEYSNIGRSHVTRLIEPLIKDGLIYPTPCGTGEIFEVSGGEGFIVGLTTKLRDLRDEGLIKKIEMHQTVWEAFGKQNFTFAIFYNEPKMEMAA